MRNLKSHHCEWECRVVQQFWEIALQNVNVELPYEPAILLLGIHPREYKTYIHTKTCTQMFITALFTVAKR